MASRITNDALAGAGAQPVAAGELRGDLAVAHPPRRFRNSA
jgi:hypothetical protein